jgi:hypothetical protein
VQGGREKLNFSAWDQPQGDGADDVVEAVRGGSMPRGSTSRCTAAPASQLRSVTS